MSSEPATPGAASRFDVTLVARLGANELSEPQALLGPRPASRGGRAGVVVRCWHPDAAGVELLLPDREDVPMERLAPGLFEAFVAGSPSASHRFRLAFPDGAHWEREDPYRFPSTLGELDLHLFAEGRHRELWRVLGAHPRVLDGVSGVVFAVWAPDATRVSVVGDFCGWDGRLLPMCGRGGPGVFELFVPGVERGALYKFEIRTAAGALRLKTDPFAFSLEHPPDTASRVEVSRHVWGDETWLASRSERDPAREPMAVYEVHLGSWARVPEEDNRVLTYREIAPKLVEHAKRFGFTHLELMPVMEHPFDGSWGYQVSGYYAPTSRHGTPDDFRFFVDHCHRNGVGVILDWVPAHFPRDDFALRRFDGETLYEYDDPRLGEHPDWGTLVFDYGRHEVRNFLIANALYWIEEFHVDGLRVDAVASMLYRDYSRNEGEWLPNVYGGRENLEAITFLRDFNDAVHETHPGVTTIAEESTSWPGVTRPTHEGGLGFSFKWNMGWMNDTLRYFAREPVHRSFHLDDLTFASLYEWSERFVMPLSHDEIVHGKGALLAQMPGDPWQKLANLRLLLGYQWTRPGKKLVFMGTELAPWREWAFRESLDWHLAEDPERGGLVRFLEALGVLYHAHPCLWRGDPEPESFEWIAADDRDNSIVSYLRRDGDDELVVVMNLTPVPRDEYRIGVPHGGGWREVLNSDAAGFGGGDYVTRQRLETDPVPLHRFPHSLRLSLPPLGVLVLERDR